MFVREISYPKKGEISEANTELLLKEQGAFKGKKMKKIKFDKKLMLNKETITKLNSGQMTTANGGGFGSSQNGGVCVCTSTLISCPYQTWLSCHSDCANCSNNPDCER